MGRVGKGEAPGAWTPRASSTACAVPVGEQHRRYETWRGASPRQVTVGAALGRPMTQSGQHQRTLRMRPAHGECSTSSGRCRWRSGDEPVVDDEAVLHAHGLGRRPVQTRRRRAPPRRPCTERIQRPHRACARPRRVATSRVSASAEIEPARPRRFALARRSTSSGLARGARGSRRRRGRVAAGRRDAALRGRRLRVGRAARRSSARPWSSRGVPGRGSSGRSELRPQPREAGVTVAAALDRRHAVVAGRPPVLFELCMTLAGELAASVGVVVQHLRLLPTERRCALAERLWRVAGGPASRNPNTLRPPGFSGYCSAKTMRSSGWNMAGIARDSAAAQLGPPCTSREAGASFERYEGGPRMDFRILGPLEVHDQKRPLALGGRQQRALLALLLLHANEAVPVERDHRRALARRPTAERDEERPSPRLETAQDTRGSRRHPTETLGATASSLHEPTATFSRLHPASSTSTGSNCCWKPGRGALAAGHAGEASATLRKALAVWRGPPLAEFAIRILRAGRDRDGSRSCGCRRSRSASRRISQLGRSGAARSRARVARCQSSAARAATWATDARAVPNCGRQPEALQAYQDTRRLLVDELGVEPTPALQRLERAILLQEESLEPPEVARPTGTAGAAGDAKAEAGPLTASGRPARQRHSAVAGVGALLLAVAASATLLLVKRDRSPAFHVDGNSVAVIDATSNRIERQVAVGARPAFVASDGRALWVANLDEDTISRIDPRNRSGRQYDRDRRVHRRSRRRRGFGLGGEQ